RRDTLLPSSLLFPYTPLFRSRPPDPGVQQAQVVVDLGHRPHGRTGVAAGRLLVDGDGRRQSLDEVDVGFVHLAQELPGVRRKRLDRKSTRLNSSHVKISYAVV